ncbi:hypothetical protein EW026_g1910 [Hermanssonia centrifuga]|uniref:laccase n=1 Tax=Hermanssonia centrifuga TaxID=98765 RepID=A0A4S4KRQ5_9APHY|nr:hypothetical protein EW026_g1910 [Hermanssonia centrifuga]
MQSLRPFFTLAAACLPVLVHGAIGPIADLAIVNAEVNPDGFSRQAVLAGGTFPGPVITGTKGANFQINVMDQLTNETMLKTTTVHWHGIAQHGTNWADGTGFVTQCPIASGDSFLYDFNVPNQAGTFWYHSHLSLQYCDGLRGAMIVYDPEDPHADLYDVDNGKRDILLLTPFHYSYVGTESTIITLSDWYHAPVETIPVPPTVDSTLINGLGRYPSGPSSELAVINVEAGKRYRFRLIAMACNPYYTFSVDGHNMTIIEVDGVNSQPLLIDSLNIYAGQRYSFVLEANQPVGNYWVRSEPNAPNLSGFDNGINSAILRYVGAPETEPTSLQSTSVMPLYEYNLHPLDNPAAPGLNYTGGVDYALNLNLGFNGTPGEGGYFVINEATFNPPTVPVLLQILSGAQYAQELLPAGSVYGLPMNASIELTIPPGAAPDGPHPFHLHGTTFSVVRSAGSDVYNYDNPIRRDTVSTGTAATDNVTIRWETNTPGPWFLHCHIDFHLKAGMAIVFAEDMPDIASANPVPESWNELCPTYDELSPDDY